MNAKRDCCPICNSDAIAPAFEGGAVRPEWKPEGRFEVWECSDCTHRFLNPLPDAAVLERCYSAGYAPYAKGNGTGALDKARAQAEREKRFRHIDLKPDLDILDVGCGSGSFLYAIQTQVGSVFGIEPSEHGVATCKSLGVPVFHGFMEDYSATTDRRFDVITANHVVEHHPDPVALFKLCARHLKPGGFLWVSVPNAGCWFARQLGADWHSSDLPVHLQHFTPRSMALAMERAGLQVADQATESENTLSYSAASLLRRYGVPKRLSAPFLSAPLSKKSFLGARIDRSGNGEAVLTRARL